MKLITKSLILFLLSLSLKAKAQTSVEQNGRTIFERNCAKCHGEDGTKGRFGAKNLQTTSLSDAEMLPIISKGKRIMPSWENKLSKEEILALISHIRQLHIPKQP